MNLDKNALLDLLRSNGQHAEADQAAAQLPDQVDTEQHAGLLSKLGVDLPSLLARFTGGNAGGGGLGGMLSGLTGGQHTAAPAGDEQSEGTTASGDPETGGGGLSGLLGRL